MKDESAILCGSMGLHLYQFVSLQHTPHGSGTCICPSILSDPYQFIQHMLIMASHQNPT